MTVTFSTTGTNPATAPPPTSSTGIQGAPREAAKVSAAPPPTQQRPVQPQAEQIQKAVQSMKQLIEAKAPNSLAFSVDDSSGKTVVRITDKETGETIRQIPSEEMLEIARSLDKFQGMLVQQKA
jgi:flagellar protein FlaG